MPYDLEEFIQERRKIQLKKENGEPAPWTTDEVLTKHHFCNIDRMHDAFSIWLSSHWYGQFPPNAAKVASAVVARYFNSPAVLNRLHIPHMGNVHSAYVEAAEAGERLFNYQAYFRANRVQTVQIVLDAIRLSYAIEWTNAEDVYKKLASTIPHIGPFLSSQITLDLVQYRNLPLGDWIPIGPGSARGVNRYFDNDADYPIPINILRRHIKSIATDLTTNVIITEHALCEWDKYLRITENPKKGRKYNPGSATLLKARGKK